MLNIIHQPIKDCHSNYIAYVSSIDEAITEMIPRIRKQSQEFYTKNIREQLELKGTTIIDRHAGNGSFYTIVFVRHYCQITAALSRGLRSL